MYFHEQNYTFSKYIKPLKIYFNKYMMKHIKFFPTKYSCGFLCECACYAKANTCYAKANTKNRPTNIFLTSCLSVFSFPHFLTCFLSITPAEYHFCLFSFWICGKYLFSIPDSTLHFWILTKSYFFHALNNLNFQFTLHLFNSIILEGRWSKFFFFQLRIFLLWNF